MKGDKTKALSIVFVLFLVISIIIFPKNSLAAAKSGINLWLFTVFPALLPFFIGSEMLVRLGFVKMLGKFLEPIMRPIFNVSGNGGFAMAVGYTSGYPVGAQIIKRLWEEKLLNTAEAERLMTFCNNSGPLFMLGVVAMGMFNSSTIGYIIMLSNYLAAITTGIIFRNYNIENKHLKSSEYHNIRQSNPDDLIANFGEILGSAVKDSMNTIIMIGGYIITFSVLIEFLKVYGLIDAIEKIITPIFEAIGFNKNLIAGYLSGLMEITIGSNMISQATAPLYQKVILISSILAWGGLSTHGQVIGVINNTKISYLPYLIAKAIHSIFAGLFSFVFMKFINIDNVAVSEAFYQGSAKNMISIFEISSLMFVISILSVIFLVIITSITNKEA
ncbi:MULTISPECIES: sporulation integral membrane protein YlbJ [unclassified Thermoanaerobacterium]|uniref:sporulation integral membrane protein YlbJ n=1 Tax=unclassified Thermoanaerobacterium TaxID=2622527 RepID=UPI000A1614D8|nr:MULTISPECIES: sporulation integral membrane protein YlbJ [unclassified Thermoanaerobacterium]MDE4541882.1 sporulation integral membrane protein YlbJ [Thermoanaerobacterium sp. R66]ORX24286.1 sporulation integral membrane protein YlbJ [Thermoanaerobacterium sp. PSU-2]HHV73549.1 sporulation integral membrane protein YlbJ [Thermoanaerobacterium sp.]